MLVDTIGPLWDDPGSVEDPYIRTRNFSALFCTSTASANMQKIVKWLDHPGQSANKPSVLMDQLNALQPSSIVEVQKIMFLRKMPAYIRNMINLKDF